MPLPRAPDYRHQFGGEFAEVLFNLVKQIPSTDSMKRAKVVLNHCRQFLEGRKLIWLG